MSTPPSAPLPPVEKAAEQDGSFRHRFARFAQKAAALAGSPGIFVAALAAILIWALLGPKLAYSDTWQLVINTLSSVITFLMVFLIQNTQNRDSKAIHLKLDEVIRALKPARDEMIDIEKLSDKQLEQIAKHYERIRAESDARKQREKPAA